MSFRSNIATHVGRLSRWALTKFTGGGSSLPGKLALTIDPEILTALGENYDVAIITGTNGKTLTTALSVYSLNEAYPHVLTNPTGSNMHQGIVSTFLAAPRLEKNKKGIAVLEVDEGSLKHVVKHIKPKVFIHTNVFRDQMDRYGEIYTIYKLMADAAKEVPEATVISNADSPILNSIDLPNPRLYFGFDDQMDDDVVPHHNTDGILCPKCNNTLKYHSLTYANQGKYYCDHCGFKRPALDFKVSSLDDLNLTDSTFTINDHQFKIPIAGLYNIYNALAAYSLSRFFDLTPEQIHSGFEKAERVFGRQEILDIEGKQVLINLVKNPVGLNQVIDLVGLDKNPSTFIAILNNHYADGTDVSWIWDGDFEKMADFPIEAVYTSGMRKEDMTKRLEVANVFNGDIQQLDSIQDVIDAIRQATTDNVHIFATYTAMLDLRKELSQAGYIKK